MKRAIWLETIKGLARRALGPGISRLLFVEPPWLRTLTWSRLGLVILLAGAFMVSDHLNFLASLGGDWQLKFF